MSDRQRMKVENVNKEIQTYTNKYKIRIQNKLIFTYY